MGRIPVRSSGMLETRYPGFLEEGTEVETDLNLGRGRIEFGMVVYYRDHIDELNSVAYSRSWQIFWM